MFHSSILLSTFKEVLRISDFTEIEVFERLRSKGVPHSFSYNIFCWTGMVCRTKSVPIKVPISVDDTCVLCVLHGDGINTVALSSLAADDVRPRAVMTEMNWKPQGSYLQKIITCAGNYC